MRDRTPGCLCRVCCASCGQAYAGDAWRDLPRVCTLSGDDVHRHVVAWPEGRVIEVRVCRTCGQSMARTASISPLSPQPDAMRLCRTAFGDRS